MLGRSIPVLSICIPSYNRSALLRDSLREIDRADFLPFSFEVIVVDNASDDPGYSEIASYRPKHHSFTYIRRPNNVGAYRNVIGSLRAATGTFCVYLADDDRLVGAVLARYVTDMEAIPDIVATYAVFDEIDLTTNRLTSLRPRFEPQLVDIDTVGPMIKVFRDRQYLPEVGIFRTEALMRSLLPCTAINYAALHFERVIRLGHVRFADEPFYQFVSGCDLEPYPRQTNSRSPTLDIFDGGYRGIAILHLRLALPKGEPPRQLTGLEKDYLLVTIQALDCAIGCGRALEACELALLVDGLLRLYSPDKEFSDVVKLDDTITLACFEAVSLLAGDMPNIESFAVSRLEQIQIDRFAEMRSRFETSKSMPIDIVDFDALEPNDRTIVLTDTEQSRAALIAERAAKPGLTFSLEGLHAILQP